MLKNEDTSVLPLLYRLINTQSDSGTLYEKQMEAVLIKEISQMPYFENQPDHFGLKLVDNDT